MRNHLVIIAALAASGCSDGGPIVVRTVYDRTGTPAAGIRVQVGELPWTTTGEDGTATFASPGRPFTVSVHQTYAWIPGDQLADHVWVFRDRTASVLAEVEGTIKQPGWHDAQVRGTLAGRSGPSSSNATVRLPTASISSPTGPMRTDPST